MFAGIGRIRLLPGMLQRLCAWLLRSQQISHVFYFLHGRDIEKRIITGVGWLYWWLMCISHFLFLTGVECFHTVLAEYFVGLGMTGVDLGSRTVCQGAIFIIMLMGLEEPVFQSDPPGLTSIHPVETWKMLAQFPDRFVDDLWINIQFYTWSIGCC